MAQINNIQEVRLPFDCAVPSQSYLDYALPLSCLAHVPEHKSVYYSNNVQLFFPDSLNGLCEPKLNKFMMFPGLNNWQWEQAGFMTVESYVEMARRPPNDRELLQLLRQALESGYYVETRLNEFYLSARPHFFNKHHALHINLVVGISSDSTTVQVAGYGTSYGVSSIPFREFMLSFFNAPTGQPKLRPEAISTHRMIWLWRICDAPNPQEIDLTLVAGQLADYIEGTSSRERRLIATDDHLAFPLEQGTWGMKCYESWRIYLHRLRCHKSKMDIRASRTMWEHKESMMQRLFFLREANVYIPDILLESFLEIKLLAKAFRLEAFVHRKKEHEASLRTMEELIDTLERLELEAYPRLHDAVAKLSC